MLKSLGASGVAGVEVTDSKLRILAALVEARGTVREAAKLAGVSKQYIYEVMGKLKRGGIRLRGYPFLSSLGRVFIVFSPDRQLPDNGFQAACLKLYRFDGATMSVGIYVIPSKLGTASPLYTVRGCLTEELMDVFLPAPWHDIEKPEPREEWRLPNPIRVELDEEDKVILSHLYEDLTARVTGVLPSVSKSLLSYHYRAHVRKLLQVLIDFHPERMHSRPLLLAELRAPSREWMGALMRAKQVYALAPKIGGSTAYALLDGSPYDLVKKLVAAREGGRLAIDFKLLGYIDPDDSTKFRIPRFFTHAGLRTA